MERELAKLFNKTFSNVGFNSQSVSQIQQQLTTSSKASRTLKDRLPVANNITQFSVTSPFYDRNKICKALNCFCPYHKRIRQEAAKLKKQVMKQKNFHSNIQSPLKKLESLPKFNGFRLSHKSSLQNNEQNRSLAHSPLKKVKNKPMLSTYNQYYQEFLNLHNQLLSRQFDNSSLSLHLVRSSVGEIFNYLYNNLDKDTPHIQNYINGVEKDRDISNFYVERFQDLKKRKTMKQRTQAKLRTNFSKHTTIKFDKNLNENRSTPKKPTYFDKNSTASALRKLNKSKTRRKLMIQHLLKYVEDGQQIQNNQFSNIVTMELDLFQANIQFLRKKIQTFDVDTLTQIKQQILLKFIDEINKDSQQMMQINETLLYKKEKVIELIGIIDKRVKDEEMSDSQSEELKDQMSCIYSKGGSPRKCSNAHPSRRSSNFSNQLLKKSSFNERFDEQDLISMPEQSQSEKQIQDKTIEAQKRQSHCNTIFISLDDSNMDNSPNSMKKGPNKLKLAKYRRLSHQNFYHQTILNENQDYDNIIPAFNIQNVEEMSNRLDEMASQFGQKWKKMKQIQIKITEHKMKGFIIDDNDSLFTVKRKARVFKKLLKENAFTDEMKGQIKQYINLVEQQTFLKNRSWAYKKIKDMLGQQVDVELGIEHYQQKIELIIKDIINNVFTNRSKLVYYDLLKTQYIEKEINFQDHIFCLIEKDTKKKVPLPKHQSQVPVSRKESQVEQIQNKQEDLVQISLQNKYGSSLIFEQTINYCVDPLNRKPSEHFTSSKDQPQTILRLIRQFNNLLG